MQLLTKEITTKLQALYSDYPELGYFSLSELQDLKGPMGLSIERDMYFKPIRLSEIKKLHEPGV